MDFSIVLRTVFDGINVFMSTPMLSLGGVNISLWSVFSFIALGEIAIIIVQRLLIGGGKGGS